MSSQWGSPQWTTLEIIVISYQDLKADQWFGRGYYCSLECGAHKGKTKAARGGSVRKSVWNEAFSFDITDEGQLTVKVKWDTLGVTHTLGQASCDLAKVMLQRRHDTDLPVINPTGQTVGLISLQLNHKPAPAIVKKVQPAPSSGAFMAPDLPTPSSRFIPQSFGDAPSSRGFAPPASSAHSTVDRRAFDMVLATSANGRGRDGGGVPPHPSPYYNQPITPHAPLTPHEANGITGHANGGVTIVRDGSGVSDRLPGDWRVSRQTSSDTHVQAPLSRGTSVDSQRRLPPAGPSGMNTAEALVAAAREAVDNVMRSAGIPSPSTSPALTPRASRVPSSTNSFNSEQAAGSRLDAVASMWESHQPQDSHPHNALKIALALPTAPSPTRGAPWPVGGFKPPSRGEQMLRSVLLEEPDSHPTRMSSSHLPAVTNLDVADRAQLLAEVDTVRAQLAVLEEDRRALAEENAGLRSSVAIVSNMSFKDRKSWLEEKSILSRQLSVLKRQKSVSAAPPGGAQGPTGPDLELAQDQEQAELERLSEENKAMEARLAEIVELKKQQAAGLHHQKEAEQLRAEKAELQRQLDELAEMTGTAAAISDAQTAELRASVQQLAAELQELKAEEAEHVQSLAQQRESAAAQLAAVAGARAELDAVRSELAAALSEQRGAAQQATEAARKLQAERDALELELNSLGRDKGSNAEDAAALMQQIAHLQSNVEMLEGENHRFRASAMAALSQREEASSLRKELEAQHKEMTLISNQLTALQQELNESRAQRDAMAAEAASLRQQLAAATAAAARSATDADESRQLRSDAEGMLRSLQHTHKEAMEALREQLEDALRTNQALTIEKDAAMASMRSVQESMLSGNDGRKFHEREMMQQFMEQNFKLEMKLYDALAESEMHREELVACKIDLARLREMETLFRRELYKAKVQLYGKPAASPTQAAPNSP